MTIINAGDLDGSHIGQRITVALGSQPVTLVTAVLRILRHSEGAVSVQLAEIVPTPNPVLQAIGMKPSTTFHLRSDVPVQVETRVTTETLAALLTTTTDGGE